MVKARLEKLGLPPIAAMSGVTMSLTNAAMTAVNAVPMTTATARSTRLPRRMNARKSLSSWAMRPSQPAQPDGGKYPFA